MELFWVGCILLLAGLAHGVNMFGCPHYEFDEGLFMARAWSFLMHGQLAPYPFTYDQTPLGWIQIAGWDAITGGFTTFGLAVDSGRAFMLVLQLGSTLCIYMLARRVSERLIIGSLAALLFAIDPYGIYYHRSIYLDTIATFWVLVSLCLTLARPVTTRRAALAGFTVGLAILSKMPAMGYLPALVLAVLLRAEPSRRFPMTLAWLTSLMAPICPYILYAALRGELFPAAKGAPRHPSLINGLLWQARREQDGGILNLSSSFWHYVGIWMARDPVLVIGGTSGAALCLLAYRSRREAAALGLCVLSFWGFLGRGGVTQPYYLINLLPLLAVTVALGLDMLLTWLADVWRTGRLSPSRLDDLLAPLGVIGLLGAVVLGRAHPKLAIVFRTLTLVAALHAIARSAAGRWLMERDLRVPAASGTLVAMIALGYTAPGLHFDRDHLLLWRAQHTAAQKASVAWIANNIDPNSTIIVENYAWTDLHDGRFGSRVWNNAFPYIKASAVPAIREVVLQQDWRRIDYLIGGKLLSNFATRRRLSGRADNALIGQAMAHARIVASFDNPRYPIHVYRVQTDSSNGELGAPHP